MASTTSGVKITVDTSDIDIKFTKSVEQLNAGLTKSQKALGLFYNEQGLLTNGLGQCVEGLSNAQIKLGQYTDELGNIRTFQGGFTEGLSKTQLALGMYADEVGNVYNAMGELVGQTDKAAKKLEREAAEAAKKAAKELEDLRKTAQESAIKLSELQSTAQESSNKLNEMGSTLSSLSSKASAIGQTLNDAFGIDIINKLSEFVSILASIKEARQQIKDLNKELQKLNKYLINCKTGSKKLDSILHSIGKKNLTVGKIASSLAAAAVTWEVMSAIFPVKEAEELSDYFLKMEEHAKKAGESIKDVKDALKHGAFAAPINEMSAAIDKVKEKKKALDDSKINLALTTAGAVGLTTAAAMTTGPVGMGIAGSVAAYSVYHDYKGMKAADAEYKNAMAELSEYVGGFVNEARENSKTAAEKLQEQIDNYEVVLELANQNMENEKKNGASAEQIAQYKEDIAVIEKQIEELREQEKQELQKAAGMTQYIEAAKNAQKKTAPTIEEFNATLEEWGKLQRDGNATQEEINLALSGKRQEIASQLAASLGLQAPQAPAMELTGDYSVEADRLKEGLSKGALSVEEYADQMDALREKARETALSDAFGDLRTRFDAGEIDADQYAQLIQGIYEENATKLSESLEGVVDASAAAKAWEDALKSGLVSQKAYNEAVAGLDSVREEYAARLNDELSEERNASKVAKAWSEALEEGLVTQRAYDEATKGLEALQKDYAEALNEQIQGMSWEDSAKAWKEALDAGAITQEQYNEELEKTRASLRDQLASSIGVSVPNLEAKPQGDALTLFSDNKKKLDDALASSAVTQEEYNAMMEELKTKAQECIPSFGDLKKAQDKGLNDDVVEKYHETLREQNKLGDVGKDARDASNSALSIIKQMERAGSISDETKEALNAYNSAISRATDAFEQGVLDKEQRDAMIKQEAEKLGQALQKEKEAALKAAEEKKKSIRGALGIDQLIEETKTPLEKYRETMEKVDAALQEKAITGGEADLLELKAQEEYWNQMDKLAQTAQQGAEKLELGRSSASGSESLYLAMAKNSQANFQNKIQSTTGRIATLQQNSLMESQRTNALLETIASAGATPVYRG